MSALEPAGVGDHTMELCQQAALFFPLLGVSPVLSGLDICPADKHTGLSCRCKAHSDQ